MKKIILLLLAVTLTIFIMSSCCAVRKSGCPDTWGKVGYN